jgi:hypothetical protein
VDDLVCGLELLDTIVENPTHSTLGDLSLLRVDAIEEDLGVELGKWVCINALLPLLVVEAIAKIAFGLSLSNTEENAVRLRNAEIIIAAASGIEALVLEVLRSWCTDIARARRHLELLSLV